MRRIDEIIVHCTASKPAAKVTVESIDRYHRSLGWNGCGYHYVIYKDGSVHAGRDIALKGAHTTNHNAHSIGVCYVGGLDANGKASDTRTAEQKAALASLITELKRRFPTIAKVSGHRDYARKACPCFDAHKEYNNLVATKR